MVLSKQVSYRYHNKRKSFINGLFTPFMKLCLLLKLLGGEIYLAVFWYTFVHFILHILLILHFCVPHLKFLEPKWSQTELFLFFNFFNFGSVSSYADINFTSRFNIPNTFYSIIFAICSLVNIK